jgi:hypothetical protein
MSGFLWAALGTVVGLVVPLLYLRRRDSLADESGHIVAAPSAPPAPVAKSRPKPPAGYHGVAVKPCENACEAVRAIVGERFLSRDAPALPLATCDQKLCKCTYGHYSDRRDPEDRRTGWGTFGGFAPSLAGGNRRNKGLDRRR